MLASNRRTFLRAAASAAALPQVALPQTVEPRVFLTGDGVNLPPSEYVRVLATLDLKADVYLKGGVVEELEGRFAKLLGKEKALFFPTGTLANHVAVRLLAGERKHVLVQEESHLYRDEGDCAQTLSGLNLVPLAAGRATIKASEIVEAVEKAGSPPYPVPVGAISIESPVRRMMGRSFDFEEMKKISAYAREKKIGLHLDGARMYLASAYTGISPAKYSELFDTVYVSMYKYFNAPFGAMLTGPAAVIDAAAILRHQFGGGMLHAWGAAAIALHYSDGFEERYQKAVQRGNELLTLLEQKKVKVQRLEAGTNIFQVEFPVAPGADFQKRLAQRGVVISRPPAQRPMNLMVNETILRRPAEQIAGEIFMALG
ncbi:MAG TPA: aminotransferase class I/II-fold pyridoxal phosphate-dependent enzyme [Bryobacteraceae bacterium]|nr:aminotransferase class I/II-fold pyridoxal phosphate-dependent enzyme [Bryobacteraceae bacterium]